MFAANKTRHRLSGVGGGFTLFEPGTSSFVVPTGVTSISAVAIGGGGGGRDGTGVGNASEGGGGGALAWSPSIAVTPGETLTLVVGNIGSRGDPATSGTASSISRGGTTLLSAAGGTGGANGVPGAGGTVAGSVGSFRFTGGTGSIQVSVPGGTTGGGGAAGYFGDGGGSNNAGNGSGGAGGMGGNFTTNDQTGETVNGGGTFPFGYSGLSGNKGANNSKGYFGSSSASTTELPIYGNNWFGFGGGGGVGVGRLGFGGGSGAIRVLWNTEGAMTSFVPPSPPTVISSQFFQPNASTPGTVTIPAGVQVGDVILLYLSYVRFDSVAPSTTGSNPPTNFTQLLSGNLSSSGTYRAIYYLHKRFVLDSSIAGTTVTIPSVPAGTATIAMIVLRGALGINVFQNISTRSVLGLQTTDIAITNTQTFNATNQTGKGIVVTFAFLQNFDGYGQTVTWTGGTQLVTGINTLQCYYKIYPFSATSTDDSVSASSGAGVKAGLVFPLTGY